MKQKINRVLRKTGVKLGLAVSGMCLTLLAILNILVIEKSQDSFVNVLEKIQLQPADVQSTEQGFIINRIQGRNFLVLDEDGQPRVKPLQEQFIEDFQKSLIWISGIAIATSILMGFLAATIFTRPLKSLAKGIKNLRKNNYQFKLDRTDTEEFDIVIDEFNILTEELQKIENLRKDLISDTSHELKTPITSLSVQLQGVKDGVLDMNQKRVQDLIEQVDRLSDLVERMQEFSRLRSKAYKLNLKEVKFQKFINKVVDSCKTDLEKEGITVVIDVPSDYKVKIDKELMERVFINLINNSIKYAKCSEIKIQIENNQIIFRDNGIGIPNEHHKYIFERFYRVEKSRNRSTGGLGLGLAIVKEIIESHGWNIDVDNNKDGGAEFRIGMGV